MDIVSLGIGICRRCTVIGFGTFEITVEVEAISVGESSFIICGDKMTVGAYASVYYAA